MHASILTSPSIHPFTRLDMQHLWTEREYNYFIINGSGIGGIFSNCTTSQSQQQYNAKPVAVGSA